MVMRDVFCVACLVGLGFSWPLDTQALGIQEDFERKIVNFDPLDQGNPVNEEKDMMSYVSEIYEMGFIDGMQEKASSIQHNLARTRRSPQSVDVTGNVGPGGAGSVRVDAGGPFWKSRDGAHSIDGGAYYQRNFHTPGPRQDWGGNVRYTWRF